MLSPAPSLAVLVVPGHHLARTLLTPASRHREWTRLFTPAVVEVSGSALASAVSAFRRLGIGHDKNECADRLDHARILVRQTADCTFGRVQVFRARPRPPRFEPDLPWPAPGGRRPEAFYDVVLVGGAACLAPRITSPEITASPTSRSSSAAISARAMWAEHHHHPLQLHDGRRPPLSSRSRSSSGRALP